MRSAQETAAFGIRPNRIGILPAGALGVAFYHHLTAGRDDTTEIVFIERPGSTQGERELGTQPLHLEYDGERHELANRGRFAGELVDCYARGDLPELILVAVNPDQLDRVLDEMVRLLEWIRDRGALDERSLALPLFLFVTNGIYFNRVRYRYVELLERAMMEGMLPELWPSILPRLVCQLLRGPTMQSGRRTGSGAHAVYYPGHQGLTLISGGDTAARERAHALLSKRSLPVQITDQPPVSIELRKALVNLVCNLFGVIYSVEADGRFRAQSIGRIIGPKHHADFFELGEHLYAIGRAIRAVPGDASFDAAWPALLGQLQGVAEHTASTVQGIAQAIAEGHPLIGITPNEAWLLEPLKEIAADVGLLDSLRYFSALEDRYEEALSRVDSRSAAAVEPRGQTWSLE